MLRKYILILSILFAPIATSAANSEQVIEEVVSIGVQPGPKMWRLTKDDHELWIFGTLSPIPKEMEWDSQSVEAVLAESQEIILDPGIQVSANPLKGIFALPLLWGIQNNPDKKKLQDLMPDELYQRWLVLKETYIGSGRKIEKHRPIFAANKLYAEALAESDLESDGRVHQRIEKLVKKHKIPVTKTIITRKIDQPRKLIKDFKRSSIDDVECFRKTIERLEVDLEMMQSRAQAWSRGDIPALKAMPHEDQNISCIDAVINSSFGSDLAESSGLTDVEDQLKNKWVNAAKNALQNNAVTFAVLPISQLLKPDGYLAYFRENGYVVRGG